MKSKIILSLALVLSGNLFAGKPTNSQSEKLVHKWEYITFPATLPDGKRCPTFSAGYGEHDGQGFRIDIMGIAQGFGFFKTNSITARLHRANGEIIESTAEGKKLLNSPISTDTLSRTPQVITYFPWSANTLEEAWVEVAIGSERYWLEIPYGFCRNPNDPLPLSIPGGAPKSFSAMKSLTEHDHVIHWRDVHYDLGKIQNGWRLSLIQSNPFDAESEVELYRDDDAVGKSMYLWDLHTPRTALRVVNANGRMINGFCVEIRLHEDGMRRSDTFKINRNGDDSRSWGKIEISVDDKTYQVVVPSSLFKYTHGHAPTTNQ